jgi:hypothetical protein
MIHRTLLQRRLDNDDHDGGDSKDAGYDTDDSCDVSRRRWAHNKRDTVIVRRRTVVVNRAKALVNLPSVQWPSGNQDRCHRLERQHTARRRRARSKRDAIIVRRSTVVNRGKALVNLPSVQWPVGNQDRRHRLEHQHSMQSRSRH